MYLPYSELHRFVQDLTPTWGKHQHEMLALVTAGLMSRGNLKLTEIAREMPRPDQPLHGRLKRLGRYLDNPRLDEAALFARWLRLSYHFGEDLPQAKDERPILPKLLDTVYFEPFAMLVSTVACGSRGLPVALTTYHRKELTACFPPVRTWPQASGQAVPTHRPRGGKGEPASAVARDFASQNLIEEHFIDYTFALLSPAIRGVDVADAGFARASLFRHYQARQRDFAIRFDAQTHIRLPEARAQGLPIQGVPGQVLGLQPGQRIWCPVAWYGKQEQVPISLLALWEDGYKEPWYIATSLETADLTETIYRWRMRLECANRDEKTGVILRESGDKHALISLLHLHRILLALGCAEWFCALAGLQAYRDLPDSQPEVSPVGLTLAHIDSQPNPEEVSALPTSSSLATSQELAPTLSESDREEPRPVDGNPLFTDPISSHDSGDPSQALTVVPSDVHTQAIISANLSTTTMISTSESVRVSELDLPGATSSKESVSLPPSGRPETEPTLSLAYLRDPASLLGGPASPPPVVAHRGETPKPPSWLKRFVARGPLSYVRLGFEVLRSQDLKWIARRMVRWVAVFLWVSRPLWRPWQLRYRFRSWWFDSL